MVMGNSFTSGLLQAIIHRVLSFLHSQSYERKNWLHTDLTHFTEILHSNAILVSKLYQTLCTVLNLWKSKISWFCRNAWTNLHEILHGGAQRVSKPAVIKTLNFWKSNMAVDSHYENRYITISLQAFDRFQSWQSRVTFLWASILNPCYIWVVCGAYKMYYIYNSTPGAKS